MSALTCAQALVLEERVWAALVAGDAQADRALLSADFLGVYPDGFADREAHCAQLADGPSMTAYRLSDARLRVLSADAVLLSYRAAYRRHGRDTEDVMFISSLWERRAGDWINTFSQDTPA